MQTIQMTIVDRIAFTLPWLGGLVPATMTYQNARQVLGMESWQAILVGLVVEAIGFVTIATTLDLWEMYQDGLAERRQSWDAPKAALGGQFWVALGGTLIYLFVVVSINALLDQGDALEKTTKGMMASFGLLGGLMIALRNQMGKTLASRAQARAQADQAAVTAQTRQDEIAREEREHARRMDEERLRLEHEERMRKIEEDSRRKLAKIEADGIRQPSGKAADDAGHSPDAPATRLRWSDIPPDDYRWIADARPADVVRRYNILGKDPERLARTWKAYARKGIEK